MGEPALNQGGAIGARLSVMMFLQFFVWGAWYVTVGNYMKAHGMFDQISWAYTVGPIAALISPFFLGMIADRFFSTERVLGVLHLLGAAAMIGAPFGAAAGPNIFLLLLFVHMLCYMPTLGLTNTLAFHNMTNQEKQFPLIRVWGTIGWIAAGFIVSRGFSADYSSTQFVITGAAAFLLGIYSFTLPHTPPPAKGKSFSIRDACGLDAVVLMKQPSFAVFVICSFLISIPLAAYYAYAPLYLGKVGYEQPASILLFGQVSEILFMIAMPLFFIRLGVKWMLLIGMSAWVLRYALFSGANAGDMTSFVFIGILLHGICYDFFFVTGFIYVDRKSTTKIRGQAQGLLVMVTQGLGLGIGAQLMGRLVAFSTPSEAAEFQKRSVDLAKQGFELFGKPEAEPFFEQADKLATEANQLVQWGTIWLVPAIFAAAVMVIFFLFFNDKSAGKEQPSDLETVTAAQEVDGIP
jgi:nucleoside transporter